MACVCVCVYVMRCSSAFSNKNVKIFYRLMLSPGSLVILQINKKVDGLAFPLPMYFETHFFSFKCLYLIMWVSSRWTKQQTVLTHSQFMMSVLTWKQRLPHTAFRDFTLLQLPDVVSFLNLMQPFSVRPRVRTVKDSDAKPSYHRRLLKYFLGFINKF